MCIPHLYPVLSQVSWESWDSPGGCPSMYCQYCASCPRREFITEEIKRKKVEKFGKDANNFSGSEVATFQPSPPEEFEQGIDPNTPVVSDHSLLSLSLSCVYPLFNHLAIGHTTSSWWTHGLNIDPSLYIR